MVKRKKIGQAGSFPIYNYYGHGVKVKKAVTPTGKEMYEVTVPVPPRVGGGTSVYYKPKNAVITYAKASADIIAKKKKRGRWK